MDVTTSAELRNTPRNARAVLRIDMFWSACATEAATEAQIYAVCAVQGDFLGFAKRLGEQDLHKSHP